MLPLLLATDVMALARYRGRWDRRSVAVLLPPALLGFGLGGYLPSRGRDDRAEVVHVDRPGPVASRVGDEEYALHVGQHLRLVRSEGDLHGDPLSVGHEVAEARDVTAVADHPEAQLVVVGRRVAARRDEEIEVDGRRLGRVNGLAPVVRAGDAVRPAAGVAGQVDLQRSISPADELLIGVEADRNDVAQGGEEILV